MATITMTFFGLLVSRRSTPSPWSETFPIRDEIFGTERLEQHAASLAAAQPIADRPLRVIPLRARLDDDAAVLLAAYRNNAAELDKGRDVVPAAEWLLDNYHIVEEQIREIRGDLPPGYYRQLPKLADGPFAGYPRVFGIAWAFVAHTDSHFDPETLRRFIVAYQRVQPLTIGELWAVAITLRIVLIENLRRLTDQIGSGLAERADADALADRLALAGDTRSVLEADVSARSPGPLSDVFAGQLAKRLRDLDPRVTPALGWLEERLGRQGTSSADVVQRAQQRQGASNVTVRNIITSMRLISDIDWADLFESVSLVDERLRAESAFADMDFATRNLYRNAVEQLARRSPHSELEVVEQALHAARTAAADDTDPVEAERHADPGHHLIGRGRHALERALRFRPPLRLRLGRLDAALGISGYVGALGLTTLALVGAALWIVAAASPGLGIGSLIALAAVGFVPASHVATALVDRAVAWTFGPVALPGLELADGVPTSLRTLVVVPTLLTGVDDILEQIERLEIHHLSGAGGDLAFALLTDGLDAPTETVAGDDALLATAREAIDALNRRHGPAPSGERFLLLHRRRVFDASEGVWMGWERKRGKLHELNWLLRGATDTTHVPRPDGGALVPPDVRFVITLDADTRLPRDAAIRLIGKMAHPLNRARFDADARRVVDGYGILQPRVTPSLPTDHEGSLYQRAFSGPGGMDPYAAAVSDVYQDLFGEGSYTGKGIYDVDAFEAALAGRVPDDTMLSHDLFEGIFARAGLASDIEVMEESPSRQDVAAKRLHRWTRGDWQLLPWIFGTRRPPDAVPMVGRWKMIDNLRRSILAPLTVATLTVSWLLPAPAAWRATLMVVVGAAIPALLPILFALVPRRTDIRLRNHFRALLGDLRLAGAQTLLSLVFLADRAWNMGDAVVRTIARLRSSRRHLLEWTTAAQSHAGPRPDLAASYRRMAWPTATGLGLAAVAVAIEPSSWWLAGPFALAWGAAPAVAPWVSRPPSTGRGRPATPDDERTLRLTALRTWRFFLTFVTPEGNMLPPDNFQEDPAPVVAHRTSPTNLGLYLLSAIAARDFGWAGTAETVDRLEAALDVMARLPRHNGHFYNWYDTRDLRVLPPAYVSSVDSGNLAGHLIVVANACEEWLDGAASPEIRTGLDDLLALVRRSADPTAATRGDRHRAFADLLGEIEAEVTGGLPIDTLLPALARLTVKLGDLAHDLAPAVGGSEWSDPVFWSDALLATIGEHARDRFAHPLLGDRLRALAAAARAMAMAMDFAFLLDPERKLLSIGFSVDTDTLDPNCYDLLASEARLASLFAVAKGDVETRHWFRLGRTATPLGAGSALISWSGSMFEYLMPYLVMSAPFGSLLDQTDRLVVDRQIAYGRAQGVPWGISESAYNARDIELTYQYSNFGVPGLGLKRGLSQNLVIAPYATGLATMVDPHRARRNFDRLAAIGGAGRYGFYEALDFTPARLPDDATVAIVRSYMAHHQGMTIVAIANALLAGRMRSRFHREPMIRACELLLQERMPRDVATARPRAEEMRASAAADAARGLTVRRIGTPNLGPSITHLLSNGRYAVMLTASGAGYSRWQDIAVTRWREDTTRDDDGSFVFLRDTTTGQLWSAAARPVPGEVEGDEVVFGEDHAEYLHRDGSLTTTMDVLVSGENDGEVRRISLANTGRRTREIELTSYAELVLTGVAADAAHPVFAKMFVETEYLPEFGALLATRRPRTPDETPVWVAHFAVVEGETVAEPQWETDRARFRGRGRPLAAAAVLIDGQPLSGTVGTVIDPIFALRRRVKVPSGKPTRIAFWTMVAASRAEVLALVDTHHDRSAFDRAKTLAWTQAQVQLRHLDVDPVEAADFQRLAAPILYADPRFRASSDAIVRGAAPQSGLWQHAVSGDLPIVLMRIDDREDMGCVLQLLRAHEYWRMKRLAVDVVIINEHAPSYVQDLQAAIDTALRSSQSRPNLNDEPARGAVHALRADLMSVEARALIESIARVVLIARRGPFADQLARALSALPPSPLTPRRVRPTPLPPPPPPPTDPRAGLEFFNGLGGFADDGREYVTVLDGDRTTPAPWINVVANPDFGFQVSSEGCGYTWAENSRENQITQWSNDPVVDPCGEALYVRDETTGELWSPTVRPIRDGGTYVARHGHGYSRFEHRAQGLVLDLLQFVPVADPIKISRLTLHNPTARPRRLSVTAYAEWVMGTRRSASAAFVTTAIDAETGALIARNPWSIGFSGRVAFADLAGRQTEWTADRTEFLGRHGSPAAPAALLGRAPLGGRTGAGFDPCAALRYTIDLAPGESVVVVSFLGECRTIEETRALLGRWRSADLDAAFAEVRSHWQALLGTVRVATPDRAMDVMLNGWLLYQTIACRIRARSAFYQASGAYGFRDQLQDGMALSTADPAETRRHLLRAAARQFVEGDVQHWWMPGTGIGVRTRISDDRVWLGYAVATYVAASGDLAVLDEVVPFLTGPRLAPGDHDAFFQPMIADDCATLYEHCALGLDRCIELAGAHGLPLIGTGDWNDGMNRVGENGRGESVWLAWLLLKTLALFAPFAEAREPERAARWRDHTATLRAHVEAEAWDGAWYRRATYDDGTWLGASASEECRIDSIAQSWAVLSGAADPRRARTAMASLDHHLVRESDGLALLFTPPFDTTTHDPGYIRGYPPGLRENGGQYSHAAMWAILAHATRGDGDHAHRLFALVNPIAHALTPQAVERYAVEPYVVAADVYSVAPHVGRGGWTWYTGAAGWMYRAGVEGILGLRRAGETLTVAPCLPAAWPGFNATVTIAAARIDIEVTKPIGAGPTAIAAATLDGAALPIDGGTVRVPLVSGRHRLAVRLA